MNTRGLVVLVILAVVLVGPLVIVCGTQLVIHRIDDHKRRRERLASFDAQVAAIARQAKEWE